MKLSLKKHNEVYKGIMEEYRKNPVVSESDASSSSSSSSSSSDSDDGSDGGSSSSSSSASEKKPKKKKAAAESDSDSDSDDSDASSNWDNDSESDSSDDDSDAGATGELKGRARWLKRVEVVKKKTVKDKMGRSEERKRVKAEAAELKAQDEEAKEKGALKEEELTPSSIRVKSLEIISSRGRKGSDPKVLLGQLEALAKLAEKFGPRVEIPVLMHVITAQFDMQRTIDDYMETPMWRSCAGYIERIGAILDSDVGWRIDTPSAEDE